MSATFADHLRRLGPDAPRFAVTRAEARQYCRQLAESHYENFSVASSLLPRRLRVHFQAVYAFCRWADDLGDETGGGERALRLLAWWRELLDECYAGSPTHPVFVALRETIDAFDIPKQPFADLISAFEQDQRVSVYQTYDALVDYCTRSADPVGRLVLHLFGANRPETVAYSDRVCTALQLTNFWQDVSRDLDIGRVYLPTEDRLRFGVSDRDLRDKRFTPEFRELMRFEVERTIELFHHGYPLVDLVPAEVATEVTLFIDGGMAILHKIEAAGFDVLTSRPRLAKWEKARLVASAAWTKVRRYFGGRP